MPTSVAALDARLSPFWPYDTGTAARNDSSVFQRTFRRKLMPHIRARLLKPDRSEGDAELDRPAAVEVGRPRFPDGVPVGVGVLVGDLRVGHPALRVGEEHVAVAAVVERVDHHREMIVVIEVGRVAAHVAHHAPRRIALPQPRADVDRVLVVRHPDLGLLGRGLALARLLLDEFVDRQRVAVDRVVEPAVEDQRLVQADRADRDAAVRVARHDGRRDRLRHRTRGAGRHARIASTSTRTIRGCTESSEL